MTACRVVRISLLRGVLQTEKRGYVENAPLFMDWVAPKRLGEDFTQSFCC